MTLGLVPAPQESATVSCRLLWGVTLPAESKATPEKLQVKIRHRHGDFCSGNSSHHGAEI